MTIAQEGHTKGGCIAAVTLLPLKHSDYSVPLNSCLFVDVMAAQSMGAFWSSSLTSPRAVSLAALLYRTRT